MNDIPEMVALKKSIAKAKLDALSRATRDAAEKFTADAAGKEVQPEGFREYPEDYFDATELQDSDSYKDFCND